ALARPVPGELADRVDVGVAVAAPLQCTDVLRLHPRLVQQGLVVVHPDATVGELGDTPQHPVDAVLLDGRLDPVGTQVVEVRPDLHDQLVGDVRLDVGTVHQEDVVGVAAADVGAQLGEVVRPGHQHGPDGESGVLLHQRGEALVVRLLQLLVPQPHRHRAGDAAAAAPGAAGAGPSGLLVGLLRR